MMNANGETTYLNTLLIFPPISLEERYAKKVGEIGGVLPPLGLAYIAAVLEQHGVNVSILDAPALGMSLQDVLKEVEKRKPDVVGISALTPIAHRSFALAENVKNTLPDATVVLGGTHPSIFPEQILRENSSIDVIVIGEGEYTALDLVVALEQKRDLDEVNGIAYRREGKVVCTAPRAPIENWDLLPFPARHLLPMEKYRTLPNAYKHLPVVHMITSRGCPFQCTFCYKGVFGRKYRVRSPKNVLAEIKYVIEKYKAREIAFWDDVFTMRRSWVMELCDYMIHEKLNIPWSCETRVDLVDKDLLEKMAEAGCWNIFYGFEAGSQLLLDSIKKGVTLEQSREAMAWTKKAGIEVRASFMLAMPRETPQLAEETIKFALELDPDYAQFCITTPYPGTELFEHATEYGILNHEYSKYTIWEPVFIPYAYKDEAEIRRMEKLAFRRFYLRPSYLWKCLQKIHSTEDLRRYISGLRMTLGFLI